MELQHLPNSVQLATHRMSITYKVNVADLIKRQGHNSPV